jgi:DNA polymerase (family X)
MRLEPDGLHKGRSVVAAKEVDIYRALGLPFIEPELREGRGEIERATKGKLQKLVTDDDLQRHPARHPALSYRCLRRH